MRTLIGPIVALSIAVAAFAAAPAKASDSEDLAKVLAGIATAAVLGSALEDNATVYQAREPQRRYIGQTRSSKKYHHKKRHAHKKYKRPKGHAYGHGHRHGHSHRHSHGKHQAHSHRTGDLYVYDRRPEPRVIYRNRDVDNYQRDRRTNDRVIVVDRIGGPGEGRRLYLGQ